MSYIYSVFSLTIENVEQINVANAINLTNYLLLKHYSCNGYHIDVDFKETISLWISKPVLEML